MIRLFNKISGRLNLDIIYNLVLSLPSEKIVTAFAVAVFLCPSFKSLLIIKPTHAVGAV